MTAEVFIAYGEDDELVWVHWGRHATGFQTVAEAVEFQAALTPEVIANATREPRPSWLVDGERDLAEERANEELGREV